MKCVDGFRAEPPEAEVQTWFFVGRNRMLGRYHPPSDAVATITVTRKLSRGSDALVSERLQNRVVKALTLLNVPYSDRDMSNHEPLRRSPSSWFTKIRTARIVR